MFDKEILINKRRKVRHLYFEKHLNKSQIARKLSVTRDFVRKWTSDPSIPVDMALCDYNDWTTPLNNLVSRAKEMANVSGIKKQSKIPGS